MCLKENFNLNSLKQIEIRKHLTYAVGTTNLLDDLNHWSLKLSVLSLLNVLFRTFSKVSIKHAGQSQNQCSKSLMCITYNRDSIVNVREFELLNLRHYISGRQKQIKVGCDD